MFDTANIKEDDGKVNGANPDNKVMSASAMDSVRRGIVSGIVKSLAMYLFGHCADQKQAAAKVITVLNAMRSNKDISEDEANWAYDVYYNSLRTLAYASDPECCAPCCSGAYMSWYTVLANLVDDTKVYEWSFNSQTESGLNDHEKEIIQTLRKTTNEYYEARRKFEAYFQEVNKSVLKNTIVKYGTTFQQVAPEWYKMIKSSAGLDQPVEKEG